MATMRWTPWPKDHHDEMLSALRAQGPLPPWAIEADLVFLADRANHPNPASRRAFPGRRALQNRWGVSDWTARTVLRSQDWQDTCTTLGIPLPRNQPVSLPVTNPSASRQHTGEASQQEGNQPAPLPPTNPSASTRALFDPSDPPIPEEQQGVTLRVVGNVPPAPGSLTEQQLAELGKLEQDTNPEGSWDRTGRGHHAPIRRLVKEGWTAALLPQLFAAAVEKFTQRPPTWRSIGADGWQTWREELLAQLEGEEERREAETRKAVAEESEMERRMADYRAMKARQAAKRAEREAAK